jgi:glycosyltransferase involved in cell wall biosynthesis
MSPAKPGPQLSIGLPVYNGERYLPRTFECLRAQTFDDYELIISDNASTDRTEEICREYAAGDPRVRYSKRHKNVGASRNYNFVFRQSSAPIFKWVAADDEMAPTLVERCMEALAAAPDAVAAYTLAQHIDDDSVPVDTCAGTPLQHVDWDSTPSGRFRQLLEIFRKDGGASAPMFWYGVIRRNALKKTRMMGGYFSSDLVLLSELMLQGRFIEVPECLLSIRIHPESSSWAGTWTPESIQQHLDPKVKGRVRLALEMRRYYLEYAGAVVRSKLAVADKATLSAYCASLPLRKLGAKLGAGI